jgi:hypothetical protein
MKPEEQCPSCNFDTYAKLCTKGRARINQNSDGRFFKTITCPLWAAKTAPIFHLDVCPTCGQKLPSIVSGGIGRIDLIKFDSSPSSIRPSETRVTELVEIEKRAQMTIPGIVPENLDPAIVTKARRTMRRRIGNKRTRGSRFISGKE